MRTHTALHILRGDSQHVGCGADRGRMEPLRAPMDFECGFPSEGLGVQVAEFVNAAIAGDRPVEVGDFEVVRTESQSLLRNAHHY